MKLLVWIEDDGLRADPYSDVSAIEVIEGAAQFKQVRLKRPKSIGDELLPAVSVVKIEILDI